MKGSRVQISVSARKCVSAAGAGTNGKTASSMLESGFFVSGPMSRNDFRTFDGSLPRCKQKRQNGRSDIEYRLRLPKAVDCRVSIYFLPETAAETSFSIDILSRPSLRGASASLQNGCACPKKYIRTKNQTAMTKTRHNRFYLYLPKSRNPAEKPGLDYNLPMKTFPRSFFAFAPLFAAGCDDSASEEQPFLILCKTIR